MNPNEQHYAISQSQLQALVGALAEYPYKSVANIIAALSALPPIVQAPEAAQEGEGNVANSNG